MDPISFADATPALVEVIRSRSAVLMIGAGASISSGGPTTGDLIDKIRKRFPLADIADDARLLDAGGEVADTPPYGRQALLDFLRNELDVLEPSNAYKQIPRWYWGAIYTTNYDDLVEKAYKTPGRVQTLEPVHVPATPGFARPDHLYLFYLQGSITQSAESDGSPALSWTDYNRSLQNRVVAMDLLRNTLAKGGSVVYVGYSFNDFILSGLLDEASRRVGGGNMPFGHAILPDWPTSPAKRNKVTKHNVVPVVGSFEDFAELVSSLADRGYQTELGLTSTVSPAAGYSVTVGGSRIAFSESEFGVFSEYFEVLNDAVVDSAEGSTPESSLIRAFLRGSTAGWLPFRHNWAFRRAPYDEVFRTVREALGAQSRIESRIFLVHGPAGLGKSVMARQLAFDLYKEVGAAVVLAKPSWTVRPDFRLLDRFFDDIEQKLPEGVSAGPVVLIIDEAELVERTLASRVTRYLATKGRELYVVLFARTNEYFRANRATSEDLPAKWGQPTEVPVAESMKDDEIVALVSHLESLGIWDRPRTSSKSFWLEYVKKEHAASFFDTVYALAEETQVPLRDRVITEYENLSDLGREAYRLIAALHQFGIPLKFEVLIRALDVDWPSFDSDVIRGDAQQVLILDEITSSLNLHFRGRTRRISEIVFSHAVGEHAAQLETFRRVIGSFRPNDMFGLDELDTLRTLLVQVLGPSGFDNRFSHEELAQLFAVATEAVEDDVLEHHFGLLELDGRRFFEARTHLEKALTLSSLLPGEVSGLRESPQNIENSLAIVIGELSLEALARGAAGDAERLFLEAAQHFSNARRGAFPNAAAYDAHARLVWKRARKSLREGSPERVIALANAVDILDEGLDNVNEDQRPALVELKSLILEELGQGSEAIAELSRRAESGSRSERARYHMILARLILGRDGSAARRKDQRRAWTHVVDACDLDPTYFLAQKTRVDLFRALHPTEITDLFSYLQEALRCSESSESPGIQYELGVVEFYREAYEESARAFARLRKITRGSMIPPGFIETAGDRTPESETQGGFEYEGRIIRAANGRLAIEAEELVAFGPIPFSAQSQRFYAPRLRDRVSFEIAFNYRGVSGSELKRL